MEDVKFKEPEKESGCKPAPWGGIVCSITWPKFAKGTPNCPKCKGDGMITNPVVTSLSDKSTEFEFIQCPCYKKRIINEETELQNFYKAKGAIKANQLVTIEDIEINNE